MPKSCQQSFGLFMAYDDFYAFANVIHDFIGLA